MSYEAWGTPPGPEPRYCPVCDQESHSNECELGNMQARAFIAEKQRDELLSICAELQESAEYWSEYDVPLGIVERLTVAIASVKGGVA